MRKLDTEELVVGGLVIVAVSLSAMGIGMRRSYEAENLAIEVRKADEAKAKAQAVESMVLAGKPMAEIERLILAWERSANTPPHDAKARLALSLRNVGTDSHAIADIVKACHTDADVQKAMPGNK